MRASPRTSDHKSASAGAADRSPPLRLRAVIAGLLLVPAITLFGVWGSWVEGGTGAAQSLSSVAVGLLAFFAGANALLRRHKPAWAFSAGELITVYLVTAITTSITGGIWLWGGSLPAAVAYPAWVAGSGNQYAHTILPNMPPGMIVTNRDALEGFMLGGSTAYRMEVLRAWAWPVFWWTAWVSATMWVTLCLSVIVRRRWSEQEKLPFPMTIVPLELADPTEKTFRNRIWWLGIGISASLGSLGILHNFFPSVPVVPTAIEIEGLVTNNPPWDAIRGAALYWGLWQIGLCDLMPLDFALSLIVFNLFWKAEYMFCRLGGWLITPWSGFPYGDQQNIGADLAVMASVVWLDRRYLGQVLRRALGMPSTVDDRNEGLSYRTAVVGVLGGLGFLWYFYMRAGMGAPTTAAFLILYFAMVMAIVRMRAQIGPPAHWMFGTMPEFVLTQFPGTRSIAPRGLGMMALMRSFMYEQDANPIPIQLEGLRMAERGAMRARHLTYAFIVAVPLIMVCYFWASLHIGYQSGLEAKAPADLLAICNDMLNKLDNWLRNPTGPNSGGVISIGIGAAIALALMALKLRIPLFPLHPMAFPLAFSWTIDALLPAIFIAWAVKAMLLRYGGLRAHQRALPFFLGLIVGDACIGLIG
ncbi:MAG: hypothetical protein MUQ65_09845, partial [Armatimonadetes bacterium]|nr:hypothetical protein [Armatimonadota bacterium]